jgi:SAM-dependent methyltransferase
MMMKDPNFLRRQQYATSANLDDRIAIHQRFSTNQYGWFPWLWDQVSFPVNSRVLELGCGPGEFWFHNAGRTPPGPQLHLSDFSYGMLEKARLRLAEFPQPFTFLVIDAQSIPFPERSFDLVLACHMLYHVGDREKAIEEIHRILKPGGCLVATTVGNRHMDEITELVARFNPGMADELLEWEIDFSLESGAAELEKSFREVELRRYPDGLLVTEAAPLADYILSSFKLAIPPERRTELVEFIVREIGRAGGTIRITKDSGAFICKS